MNTLTLSTVAAIRRGDEDMPEEGTYEAPHMGAEVDFNFDYSDSTVNLTIEGQWFKAKDLKALRKLLKALEAELLDAEAS